MVANELSGNTLDVYVYIVRAGEPVGTRDVTRGAESLVVLVLRIVIFKNLRIWV